MCIIVSIIFSPIQNFLHLITILMALLLNSIELIILLKQLPLKMSVTFLCIYYMYSFIFFSVGIYSKNLFLGINPIKIVDFIFRFFDLKNKKGIK